MRERLAKNLVEKGVLTTEKQNFLLFDMTTHPITDNVQKNKLIKKVQESVLSKWVNDPHRLGIQMHFSYFKSNVICLSTISHLFCFQNGEKDAVINILGHASDVLENAFAPLNDDDYDVAMKRVRALLDLDLEAEAAKEKTNEVMWAVFAAFIK